MSVREFEMEETKNTVKWAVSSHVRATYTADGAALLDIDKGMFYSLNEVGARIWVTIETGTTGITLESIVSALETHYQIPRQQLERDTAKCLEDLQRMKLIHRNNLGISPESGFARR
jgi:hypothetical protein